MRLMDIRFWWAPPIGLPPTRVAAVAIRHKLVATRTGWPAGENHAGAPRRFNRTLYRLARAAADRFRAPMRGGASVIRMLAASAVVFLCASLLPSSLNAQSSDNQQVRKFLLVYSGSNTMLANIEVTEGLIGALNPAIGSKYELYSEYRDDQRFPSASEDSDFIREIERKYAGTNFDAIFTFGSTAFRLMPDVRDALFAKAPLIYGGFSEGTLRAMGPVANSAGTVSTFSILATLDFARALQPGATKVVVITGSSAFDRSWRAWAERDLAGVRGLQKEFISDLSIAEFQQAVKSIDRRSIVIILSIFADKTGQSYIPADAAQLISEASGAPTYTVYGTSIGRGAVGGVVTSFQEVGAAMAEKALDFIASGEVTTNPVTLPGRPVADWRRLTAFGLDADLLPEGTVVEFYEPTVWERYWLEIGLAATVILLQSGLIVALLLLEKRRKAAEQEVSARRIELAHMSRVAQLGELSGALAHELNQPLAAILANAEAGTTLMARDPPDLDEVAEILKDIAQDDRRAADIINQLRQLLSKEETQFAPVDLNELVAATAQLLHSEMVVRGVSVILRLVRGGAPVSGSETQLKQVLLNLILNGADAAADQPEERRDIVIATFIRPDGWREVSIRDRGRGLSPVVANDPFRPFATTKRQGLGLGLSICRSIAQAHGGTLAFDLSAEPGARVVLALPRP